MELCFTGQIEKHYSQQVFCIALNLSGIAAKWFHNMRGTLPLEQLQLKEILQKLQDALKIADATAKASE